MNTLEKAIQHLHQKPRAMQWTVYGLLAMLLFLIWDQVAWPLTNDWKQRADAIQNDVQQVKASQELLEQFQSLHSQITAIGAVKLPGDKARRISAVQNIVNEILGKYSVSEQSFGITDGRVKRGTLSNISGIRKLGAIKGELQFTATPDVATAIIAELESDENIEFISVVRLNKVPGRKIKVRLTLEAWVIVSSA